MEGPDWISRKIAILLKFRFASGRTDCLENPYVGNNNDMATVLASCSLSKQQSSEIQLTLIPEPTARSAVPGVSPGRGLLIPHGYLHPGKCEHSEVQSSSMIAGASL